MLVLPMLPACLTLISLSPACVKRGVQAAQNSNQA